MDSITAGLVNFCRFAVDGLSERASAARVSGAVLGLLGATLLPGTASATSIAIANASFESPILAEGAATNNAVPAWTSTVSNTCSPQCYLVFNPAVGNVDFPSGAVPDGSNALSMVSGFVNVPVTQTLTATLAADTVYTLTVDIGNPAGRGDIAQFGFSLGVVGSSGAYASFISNDMSVIPSGTFIEFSASSAIAAGNPDVGRTLIVQLWGPASQGPGQPYAAFDNVRLTASAVPEPMTAAALAAGLLVLGLSRASRRVLADKASGQNCS
jgi:hypothetical protein